MKLKDKEIRELLLNQLYLEYKDDQDTAIINELGINYGASRVDVAVVNGMMHGFEIKSESDNLNRLPRQMEYYNEIFERMTIVIAPCHLAEVKEMIPDWWGIMITNRSGDKLITKRKGRKKSSQNKELLLKLLWKEDLEKFIDYMGLSKSLKKLRKHQLHNLFMKEASLEQIREFAYDVLKKRYRTTNGQLYTPYDD